MNIQHMKYALEVAKRNSISEAAKSLFITQSTLSSAIKELEKEVKVSIFVRTNRGVTLTNEGREFLGHVRQVLQQFYFIEEKYLNESQSKQHFYISTQHYAFAANAFVELVKQYGGEQYEFTLREAKTYEIIEDVRHLRSELGIIYLSNANQTVLLKLLKERNLLFIELFTADPHVFLSIYHPLSERKAVNLADLDEYPYLSFDQGEYDSFYFSE